MTEMQKQAAIKKAQLEINHRCGFFVILTDIKGANTGKNPKSRIQNPESKKK